MNSTKQINSNFVDLLGLDLSEVKRRIEIDYLQTDKSNTSVFNTNNRRIKHSEVLKILLDHIEEVDFRGEAGADKELDKLNFRVLLVKCSKKILQAAEACGLGICNSHDKIYLYNG